MLSKKINKFSKNKTVLVVPLDWGLGHATRCIPIIKELVINGCNVVIAAENNLHTLLKHEFQQLTFIPVPGYHVRYSKQTYWLPFKILIQIPKIIYRIYQEHRWLQKVVKRYAFNGVISDNRFGLFHRDVPCIYLTHQLLIKTGNRITEGFAQKLHYHFIRKYAECWVPDFAGKENMAGELSHPAEMPENVRYIGSLSRLDASKSRERKGFLLILLSGPEPQRSIFERLILKQLESYKEPLTFIRGLPGLAEGDEKALSVLSNLPSNIKIKNHLPSLELNQAILQADWVIARSGYTTIMDLLKLKQKAILVPTPGQTEQEYLAAHLMEKQLFFCVKQDTFNLQTALEQAKQFPYAEPSFDMELYKKAIQRFVESI